MDTPHFRPDFVIIPYPVYSDEKLEGLDRVVYGIVYWFEHMRDGRCVASNTTIAEITGSNLRSVSNSLNRLEDRGYINRLYKDEAKRNRSEIRTKISFKSVSMASAVWMKPDSSLDERRDSNLDEQISNINKVKRKSILATASVAEAKESKFNVLGGDILKAFEDVDPKNKTYYNNKTQRAACDFLLSEYGLEDVLKRVSILSKTNKLSYFPTINTPWDLKEKWVKLQDAVDRKRGEIKSVKDKYPII